ncbi:MAG: hypothetical protein KF901_33660 [Myxococcales bacterium]|nr:hypothetical protein [Myxococcales bacterium]
MEPTHARSRPKPRFGLGALSWSLGLALAMGGCARREASPRRPEPTSAAPTAWVERYRVETPGGGRAVVVDVGGSFRLDDGTRFDVGTGRALAGREASADRFPLDARSWLEPGEHEFTGVAGRFSPAVTLVREGEPGVVAPLVGALLGASRGASALATLESRYDEGAHHLELVWREPTTLATSRREPLGTFEEPDAELRADGDAFIVRTPARCEAGRGVASARCVVSVERVAPDRTQIASADAARLDASGAYALLVTHRATGANVRVVETRDGSVRWVVADGERAERCGDDPSERPRVEQLAIAPGGDVVALVESAGGQLWLRVVMRGPAGSRELWSEDLVDVPDLAFAETGEGLALLVADGATVRALSARALSARVLGARTP